MVEDIHDPVQGFHHHIDMIYFCQLVDANSTINEGWNWVSKQQLLDGVTLKNPEGSSESPPQDVTTLGIRAIEFVIEPDSSE
jgi:hypothetical protein